jgi:alpha-beta hydrolase superfamily lysophospholipase
VSAEERSVTLGGKAQTVYLYRPARPIGAVILSSGDLGWTGLVVDVAEHLASQGIAVLGLNSRTYLASFTSGSSGVKPADVPGHFQTLTQEAARSLGVQTPPLLIGISEGAGLSVIAVSDATRKSSWSGVIAIGLPAATEMGWRMWRDWTTWVTKRPPSEPMAQSADYMGRVTVPYVGIQSTHDEYIPQEMVKRLFAAVPEPKRLILIDASNHRFSDKTDELRQRLNEALRWLSQQQRQS